ncbi:MAG: type I DNA topoisomerase [Candidatus Gracilibacteria bacterium]|nr:type I DNA topoisomerase [Candidatus Gracilibacteria bacterium]
MAKNLVIVESPAKAKTIGRFLGKDYLVRASMGHVRDLPKSKMGVDVEHNFEPTYLISKDKTKTIKDLKEKMKGNAEVWMATDEDREGEAIAWHLAEALKLDSKQVKRIVFHEITKTAIEKALESPRTINMPLVDAQQARRVLDRLVGYELSPLLWKKVRYGLSAGRVQSVAVRLIVEREREIEAFQKEESWSVTAHLSKDTEEFAAILTKIKGEKVSLKVEQNAKEVEKALEGASYKVINVEKKESKRNPAAPFTTSTLQQEASRKLGFSVRKTMMVAQQLYEGIELGNKGQTGLITYMRTDSVNLADEALKSIKEVIIKEYGAEYALATPRLYKKKKGAQEAHEAIRPVHFDMPPQDIEEYLERDQFRLYELIWKRTLACQMAEAVFDQVKAEIIAKEDYLFQANGQTLKFAGFIKAYTESKDAPEEEEDDQEKTLPELAEGDKPDFKNLELKQHFTKPPARYTEAMLVKKLESEGIGRPSTYAPTITTIQKRGYTALEEKRLKPTDTGIVVNDLLVEHFPKIVDYKFTAGMEDNLDKIAEGKKEWVPVIKDFYEPFHTLINDKQKTIKKDDVVNQESDQVCEKCGSKMIIKLGRFGRFLACSNYPECKNTKQIKENGEAEEPEETDEVCEKCGKPMVKKRGRFGEFLGCSGYPDCKNIKSIVKETGIKCPLCDSAIVEKKTKRGKPFYGCSGYPKCTFALWQKPLDEKCPTCGWPLVEKGKEKNKVCDNKECGEKKAE